MENNILMQEIANGNERAFKQLFDIYKNKLHVFVIRLVKDRQIAEEIVLDVFTKIWLSRNIADEIYDIENFLFKMSVNRSIDFLRSAAKNRHLREIIWDEIQIADILSSDDVVINKDLQENIDRIVCVLPPQRQLIFKLSREEGMSYEQIAHQLHISKNTVKNQMVEALRFIRIQLQPYRELIILFLFFKKI